MNAVEPAKSPELPPTRASLGKSARSVTMSEAPEPAETHPPGYIEPIGGEDTFSLSPGWTLSGSYRRAQMCELNESPINDHELMVQLGDGSYHRAVWYVEGTHLRARCDCKSYRHRDRCAHLLALWWAWVNGGLSVREPATGDLLDSPPAWLNLEEP